MRLKTSQVLDAECEDDYDFYPSRIWNLNDKLKTSKNTAKYVLSLKSHEFNKNYLQINGFEHPILIKDKQGLGMRMPNEEFKVEDIKKHIGDKFNVDVIDVETQKDMNMSMKEWCDYWYTLPTRRKRLLNVISLEFSQTKLNSLVEIPQIVHELDWTKHVTHSNQNFTHASKVHKYVLMSVSGCFTDFHIDMGGSSVWYHVFKGEKLFFLIEPTHVNLLIYEKWIKMGKQHEQFLGDLVETCQLVTLKQGDTFFMPSGWIHAVYTPKDSIVFGGNFLNSFNIDMQLKVYQIEERTKVPCVKFEQSNESLYKFMKSLTPSKQSIPSTIQNPEALLQALLDPLPRAHKYKLRYLPRTQGSIRKRLRPVKYTNTERKRRMRCRQCDACLRSNCNQCKYCKDMKKLGGEGISKQCCLLKQCLSPLLPSTTKCMLCSLLINRHDSNTNTMIFECDICFEIYHSLCFWKRYVHLVDLRGECVINDDLSNSWTCANCVFNGYTKDPLSQIRYDCDNNENYDDDDDHDYNISQELTMKTLNEKEKLIILKLFCEYLPERDMIETNEISIWKPLIA